MADDLVMIECMAPAMAGDLILVDSMAPAVILNERYPNFRSAIFKFFITYVHHFPISLPTRYF